MSNRGSSDSADRAEQAEALLEHLWRLTGPGERKADPELHGALHDFLRNIGRNRMWIDVSEQSRLATERDQHAG